MCDDAGPPEEEGPVDAVNFVVLVAIILGAIGVGGLPLHHRQHKLHERIADAEIENHRLKSALLAIGWKTEQPDIMTIDIVDIRRMLRRTPDFGLVTDLRMTKLAAATGKGVVTVMPMDLEEFDILTDWEVRAKRRADAEEMKRLPLPNPVEDKEIPESVRVSLCARPGCGHTWEGHPSGMCTCISLANGERKYCGCKEFVA